MQQPHRRTSLPLFLTPEEAAEVLNITVRSVYEKIRQGNLPISPHGKPYRIDRDALFRVSKGGSTGNKANELLRVEFMKNELLKKVVTTWLTVMDTSVGTNEIVLAEEKQDEYEYLLAR